MRWLELHVPYAIFKLAMQISQLYPHDVDEKLIDCEYFKENMKFDVRQDQENNLDNQYTKTYYDKKYSHVTRDCIRIYPAEIQLCWRQCR